MATLGLMLRALRHIGCHEKLLSTSVPYRKKLARYKANFGQLPSVHAALWEAIQPIDDERNESRFFMLLFFFKNYPTESVLSVRFGIDEETVRTWIWYYAEVVAMLKDEMITMPDSFPRKVMFPVVVDGTHCFIFEPMQADEDDSEDEIDIPWSDSEDGHGSLGDDDDDDE